MHQIEKVKLYILVCNNSRSPGLKRIARFAKQFLFIGLRDTILIINLIKNKVMKLTFRDVQNAMVIEWLKQKNPDIGCHGMSIIYNQNLTSLFRIGILNSHIGILPGYRGRSVMEWSIFNGDPTGISVFFIDDGIDTGRRIVFREIISLDGYNNIYDAKNYLFSLNISMHKKAILMIRDCMVEFTDNDTSLGKRYFQISSLFKGCAEKNLKIYKNP